MTLATCRYDLFTATFLTGIVASTLLTSTAFAETAKPIEHSSILEALSASKPSFALNLRYEGVDQTGLAETANAVTYRIRAGLETGLYKNTTFLIDFDHVEDLVDDFNSTTNGKGAFPVVADPNVTELNRFQFTNKSMKDTTVVLGRQRIIFDDARFIGNVGWRQNEQTFDALRVTNESLGKLKIDAAYVTRVNRVFGNEGATTGAAAANWTGDTYLLNASYPTPIGSLTGFGYFIDADEAAINSTQTIGMKLSGNTTLGVGKLGYAASYALQSDFGSSNADYEAEYILADVSYAAKGFMGGLGYEILGADGSNGSFKTPFATLHAFNGWADKFLATPGSGLTDAYGKIGYTVGDTGPLKGLKFLAVYHDFGSEIGSTDYGSEIDLVASAKIGQHGITLKYADYSANAFSTDTTKLWASIDFAF